MTRRLLIGAAAVLLVAGTLVGIRWGARLSFFQVRRVELVGGRYLTPVEVAKALRVPQDASIFDDTAPLLARVQRLAGVEEARVVRRLPGTLRVTIREAEAIALGERGGRLVLLDTRGRPLPFDPTSAPSNLPLAEPDPLVAGLLARVRDAEPELFGGIERGSRLRQDVVLDIGGGRVLFRADASDLEIHDLVLIRDWLAREGTTWRELDARFSARIVVRGRGA